MAEVRITKAFAGDDLPEENRVVWDDQVVSAEDAERRRDFLVKRFGCLTVSDRGAWPWVGEYRHRKAGLTRETHEEVA